MRICVFDTETTSIEKPFAYNIGYTIYDTEENKILHKADYVAEQIWHNLELFTTAYYADKREIYIGRMKAKKCEMLKLGHITQRMVRDFKAYEVESAFAYNSPFDERVFGFVCDWFKIKNPFDNIPIYDIRGYVHQYIAFTPDFQAFCDEHKRYTENGNYSTTAETLFQYITKDTEFEEEHTALADSEIELEILKMCTYKGAEYGKAYKTCQSIVRKQKRVLTIEQQDKDGNKRVDEFIYENRRNYKDKQGQVNRIVLK